MALNVQHILHLHAHVRYNIITPPQGSSKLWYSSSGVTGGYALDIINFRLADTIPKLFLGQLFHLHNASVTLARWCAPPTRNAQESVRSWSKN
jgi:hypothetical protein